MRYFALQSDMPSAFFRDLYHIAYERKRVYIANEYNEFISHSHQRIYRKILNLQKFTLSFLVGTLNDRVVFCYYTSQLAN